MKKLLGILVLGLLWCNLSFAEDVSKRKVLKSNIDIAWKVDDKFIIPDCFEYVGLSGDLYETFFDSYIEKVDGQFHNNPRIQDFIINIGTYLNKEVPLNHTVKTGWTGLPEISLTKQLEGCLSDIPETYVTYDGRPWVKYKVIKSFDLKIGKELAPHINKNFESIKQVRITEGGGGSMGPTGISIIYGVLELNGKKVILPLKHLVSYPTDDNEPKN